MILLRPLRARPLALAMPVWTVLAACARQQSDAPASVAEVRAATAVATTSDFTETLGAVGSVVSAPGSAASLSAPSGARVLRVHVAEGDQVRVGQLLVEFEHSIFDAQLARANAALTMTRQARDRAQRLADLGVSPRKELEQAVAAVAEAEATLAAAQRAQSLATLRSPIAGVVSRIGVQRDETIDATRPVVDVVDPDRIEVVFRVAPRHAAVLRPAATVRLISGSSGGGDSLGTATIIAVASTVDSTTRNVTVRARPTHTVRPLRIGEALLGQLDGARLPGSIVIPIEAIVPDGEQFHVFVVDALQIAHRRVIRVRTQNETQAVISDGLRAGETIVTTGAYGVDEGAHITPVRR